jgi:hypothetical protein
MNVRAWSLAVAGLLALFFLSQGLTAPFDKDEESRPAGIIADMFITAAGCSCRRVRRGNAQATIIVSGLIPCRRWAGRPQIIGTVARSLRPWTGASVEASQPKNCGVLRIGGCSRLGKSALLFCTEYSHGSC